MHNALIEVWVALMVNDTVLVAITASREKGEIVYRVDCSSNLTSEEFEYYLEELIKGVCKWKPGICEEDLRSFKSAIREEKKKKRREKTKKET
jgi:hypothetical protein